MSRHREWRRRHRFLRARARRRGPSRQDDQRQPAASDHRATTLPLGFQTGVPSSYQSSPISPTALCERRVTCPHQNHLRRTTCRVNVCVLTISSPEKDRDETVLCAWRQREHEDMIAFLREENRVLNVRLAGQVHCYPSRLCRDGESRDRGERGVSDRRRLSVSADASADRRWRGAAADLRW